MGNKLNKEYLLDLYFSMDSEKMLYALTILKSMGLRDWFAKYSLNGNLFGEFGFLTKNIQFLPMFDEAKIKSPNIRYLILNSDGFVDLLSERTLHRLSGDDTILILSKKPELVDRLKTTHLRLDEKLYLSSKHNSLKKHFKLQ